MKLLSIALLWCLLYQLTASAGVGIHTTLVSRVHQFLSDDIKEPELYPYLLAGAFFPDAFYTCGNENASEYIHWPPFLSQAVKHYRQAFDKDDQERLKFKAFLYGIFTHQISDASWHSLGLEQGLLEMLANMDFNGDVSYAHSFLDTAGDFLQLSKILNVKFYGTEFLVPNVEDLVGLLHDVNFDISPSALLYCTSRGEAALRSEIRMRNILGPVNAQASPLLDDVLESYYLGGLQDITNSIISCLPNLNQWFEEGPTSRAWNVCGAIVHSYQDQYTDGLGQLKTEISKEDTTISPFIPHGHFGHSIAVGDFLKEPSIAIGANYEENKGSVYFLSLREFQSTGITALKLINKADFGFPPRFGSKVVRYSLMGQEFLLVTEPGTSSIYLYSGNDKILTIVDFSANTKYGSKGIKQSFNSVVVSEVGSDSIPNIILGSQYDDVQGVPQRGKVTILSGKKIAFLLLRGSGEKTVDVRYLKERDFSCPEKFQLSNGYEQFGSAIAIDNEHIYTTSNGHGVVFALSHNGDLKHVIRQEVIDDFTSVRRSSKESQRFGAKWLLAGTYKGIDYLFVGAHRDDDTFCPSCGAVYVYLINNSGIQFHTKLSLQFGNTFSRFGWSGIINGDHLYVSAPGYNTGGAIFRANIGEILNTRGAKLIVDDLVVANSMGVYTGYGESFEIIGTTMIIGEPQFGFTELYEDGAKLTGRVIIHEL